jgi:TonB family protein
MRSALCKTLVGTLLLTMLPGLCRGAILNPRRSRLDLSLAYSEQSLRRVPMHTSEFSPLTPSLARATCADSRPPEALATPDPLVQLDDLSVRVSFIVDADGRVESPFILESAGISGDQAVLGAVRYWRFRPALCNGVPTEMEARVRFVGSGL